MRALEVNEIWDFHWWILCLYKEKGKPEALVGNLYYLGSRRVRGLRSELSPERQGRGSIPNDWLSGGSPIIPHQIQVNAWCMRREGIYSPYPCQ